MSVLDRLRALFRREPPPAVEPPMPIMHMMGAWATPLCGVTYGPANPVTVEPGQNQCLMCRRIYARQRLRSLRDR